VIPDGWQQVPFVDLAAQTRNAIVGGPFGSNLVSADYTANGVPVIRGQNMGGRWVGGEFVFVSDQKAGDLAANLARPGDLVFTQRGTLGQVSLVPASPWKEYLVSQSQMKATVDHSKADPLFLYYFFTSTAQQDWIRANATQTGVPHTNLGTLRIQPVLLPPLPQQRAIAAVLGSMDDKIEQNRRTSVALQRLARAMFQAWFVDFEPVKAKADGADSFPSMSREMFESLPRRFGDSQIGPLPDGWELKPLYETAQFINGASFRAEHFCERSIGLPVVKIAELKYGITAQTEFSIRGDLDQKYRIDTGEMLYSWSGSPGTSLDTFLWTKGPALLNQHIFRVVTKTEAQKYFVYYLLKHLREPLIQIARDKQTTGLGHVTVADMRRLLIAWPPKYAFDGFARQVGPVFDESFTLMLESEKLTDLRNYLLPKLLSGVCRVGASNG
jgi:type I restriction enzyme S subunit